MDKYYVLRKFKNTEWMNDEISYGGFEALNIAYLLRGRGAKTRLVKAEIKNPSPTCAS